MKANIQLGSPPRMRGKAKKVDAQNLHQGITPAYAGKSQKTYLKLSQ